MVLAGDLRKGVTIEYDGKVYTVVDFLHVKPGKGSAFVRTTLKNVMDGKVLQFTFNPTEKFENAIIETKRMTYSYNDGELYHFFDENFEEYLMNYDQVEDALKYIKENDPVTAKFYKGKAFLVECENFVELLVTVAEPSVAGNTATNATKIVTLETGITMQVPMFVNEGDIIRVDTRSGEYMERVKK